MQLDLLRRNLLLSGDLGTEDSNEKSDDLSAFMTPAELMCQELVRQWNAVKASGAQQEIAIVIIQISSGEGGASEGFMKEIERLTETNQWKGSKVDIALCHEMYNMLDEVLEKLIEFVRSAKDQLEGDQEMVDTSSVKEESSQQLEPIHQVVAKVLKFLRISTIYATNIQYFNSYERITALYKHFKQTCNLPMIDELMGVFITLATKQNEKRMLTGLTSSNKPTTDSFNEMITEAIQDGIGLIKSFPLIIDLLTTSTQQPLDYVSLITSKLSSLLSSTTSSDKPSLLTTQELEVLLSSFATFLPQDLEARFSDRQLISQINALLQLRSQIRVADPKEVIQEIYPLMLRQVNLYWDITADAKDKYAQTNLLESLIPPKPFVRGLMSVLSCHESLPKRVHTQTLRTLFPFVILDLNQMFSYLQPLDNQYYVEACNHHELYIGILQRVAKWHAYTKIKDMKVYGELTPEDEKSSLIVDDTQEQLSQWFEKQRELVYREDDDSPKEENSESIKSQAFVHRFLYFLFHLLNFKNRSLQTHLYPHFLKPLLAIINVKPTSDHVYPINISCQLEAVRLLKEVVKLQSLDDPGAVEIVIERLREEIKNLHAVDVKWSKFSDDDHEMDINPIYRQEMIRTYLRFLSYSIVRNDPNAINFNQNFVANSRKILDSNFLQSDMMNYIFEPNKSSTDQEFLIKATDPVILQCVQLVSYLFNDLPQKIPQFIENGFLGSMLESLAKRMPIQVELITLLMKLVQTLCLNSQGAELAVKSGIMEAFVRVSCEFNAYKQFVNPSKVQSFCEVIQSVLGQNIQLAEVFLCEIFKNYNKLIDRAWDITRKYVEMERQVGEPGTTKMKKDILRMKYERQQISLEQTFEAQANLIFFYTDLESAGTNTNTQEAIKKYKDMILEVTDKIITTPLVASACSIMFPPFIESIFNFFSVLNQSDADTEIRFLEKMLAYIQTQLDNLSKLLGTSNFDQIYDIEKSVAHSPDLVICEMPPETLDHSQIIAGLKPEDLASVVFGKLKFYCEIISKSSNHVVKQKIFQNPQFMPITKRLFSLQALINRYHACIYERIIFKEQDRLKELMSVHKNVIEKTDYSKFSPFKTPLDEEEEAKNLYFKYHMDKVDSLANNRARESFKSTIELALDENISHTSNLCQHAIRKLINGYLRYLNRQKTINFETDQDINMLEFNKMIGGLIAEEFLDFHRVEMSRQDEKMTDENYDIRVMRYFCQLSATFTEFNKVLFGNYSNGVMVVEFLERGGLECIKDIVKWMIKYLHTLERNGRPKTLDKCKNIQLLWSHVIDFFIQLIEGKYIEQQFQSYLIAFKPNPAQGIKGEAATEEKTKTFARLKDYFMSVILSASKFFFVELNQLEALQTFKEGQTLTVFDYFKQLSEIFLVSFVDIYGFLSRGLTHIKVLNQPPSIKASAEAKKDKAKVNREALEQKLRNLVDMGFDLAKAKKALEITDGNTEMASEILLQNVPDLNEPLMPGMLWDQLETKLEVQIEEDKKSEDSQRVFPVFNQDKALQLIPRKELYKIIALSFKDYLNFTPFSQGKLIKKCEVIENMFFRLGVDQQEAEFQTMLRAIKESILDSIRDAHQNRDFKCLGDLSVGLEHLLSYRHGLLVNHKEVFQAIHEVMSLFQMVTQNLKEEISYQSHSPLGEPKQDWDKFQLSRIFDLIKQVEKSIQLFMYITEEGKISSDLGKLANILNSQQRVGADSMADIQVQLDALNQRNSENIFHSNKEQTAEIYHKITLLIIDLFKAMHSMDPQIIPSFEQIMHELILRGLEILNFMMNIKGFQDFDCQSCFLQNEGLRALFCIRILSRDTIYFSPMTRESKKLIEIQIQSKVLLQMLSQNEHTQMKIYENLIKSILFIYFQEKFKAKEGHDISKEIPQAVEANHQLQSQLGQVKSNTTQNTKIRVQSQMKHPFGLTSPQKKSRDDPMTPGGKKIPQTPGGSQAWKQNLLKKLDYGEIPLEDFIHFFNNVMQIQDFRSFLQACNNICIIKKKPKTRDPDIEDSAKLLLKAYKRATEKVAEEEKKDETKVGEGASHQSSTVAGRANRAQKRRERKEIQQNAAKPQEEDEKEGEKAIQEEYFIVLNHGSMKDMINQYEANNSSNTAPMTFADTEKFLKGHLQKFQQEIVFTILDLFIEQIRDQQMLILQHSKQKLNPSPMGLQSRLDHHGHLVIKNSPDQSKASNRLSYQMYLFDSIQLLSHFTFMSTHSPILIHSLLRHKEGKTFKFIIRNLYFLMTMVVDETIKESIKDKKAKNAVSLQEKEYTVWFDHMAFGGGNRKRIEIVNEFFKRVMFDNPHLTHQERKAKQDARQIFQKEVLKNLSENAGPGQAPSAQQKFPLWPNLRIIYNLGALWLMSVVFSQESMAQSTIQDKHIKGIVASMQMYRNIYRNIMIKSIIHECQSQHLKPLIPKNANTQTAYHSESTFALLSYIQLIQQDVKENLKFFESQKDPFEIQFQSLYNILIPFEAIFIGKDQANEAGMQLGFVSKSSEPLQPQLGSRNEVIDEEMDDDGNESSDSYDEDEDDEMDEDEDSEQDDQLLGSDLSEPNYRFSQHDLIEQEPDGEDGEDDYNSEDDEDEGSQRGRRRIPARRGHHQAGDFSSQTSNELSDSFTDNNDEVLDERNPADMQIIHDLLNRGPSQEEIDLIDYDNELDDEEEMELDGEDEEDLEEEVDDLHQLNGDEASSNHQSQRASPRQEEEKKDLEPTDENMDDEYGESEADYDDEEAEEEEEDYGDEEYGQEVEGDDQEEVQIYIGRNPEMMERLSLQDLGFNQQRAGMPARREDMLSMNNMSLDMFNLGRAGGLNQNHDHYHENPDEISADFSSDQQDREENLSVDLHGHREDRDAPPRYHPAGVVSQHRIGGVDIFNDLVGLIMGSQGGSARSPRLNSQQSGRQHASLAASNPMREDLNYKPVQTMLDIVSLGKEMQRNHSIYKQFIKEIVQDQTKPAQQITDAPGQVSSAETNVPDQQSTISQFSGKNPFDPQIQEEDKKAIFGIFDPRSLQNLAAQPLPQAPPRRQQMPADDIELDPEFMENLDQTGLQNIADSENMMRSIQNQSNRQQEGGIYNTVQLLQSISNREERARILRNLPAEVFNQLPAELMTEGLIHRRLEQNNQQAAQISDPQGPHNQLARLMRHLQPGPNGSFEVTFRLNNNSNINQGNNGSGNWNQVRSRLHSMDQQLNDITDFSVQPNDPYISRNPQQQPIPPQAGFNSWISQTTRLLQNMTADNMSVENNLIYITFNQFLHSHIEDMKLKPALDSKGVDLNQACEALLNSSLLKHFQDLSDINFQALNNLLEMIMTWVKFVNMTPFVLEKETKLMEIIYRIPNVRKGLIVKTIQWMIQGVEQLREFEAKAFEIAGAQVINVESYRQGYQIDVKENGVNGKITVLNFLKICLKCFYYLASQTDHKKPSLYGLEFLRVPESDVNLAAIIDFSKLGSITLSLKHSLLTQLLDSYVVAFKVVNHHPVYLTGEIFEGQEDNDNWDELLGGLSQVLKQISSSYRLASKTDKFSLEASESLSVRPQTIQDLCSMILQREFKTKSTQKKIRAILNSVSIMSGEGQSMVEELFKGSLMGSLKRFVAIIEESKIEIEALKKEVTVINQILKFSKSSTNGKSEGNICEEDLFFKVVKAVSDYIDRKQLDNVISSIQQAGFMFKEDFRQIMTTLFILFEYNLKTIFTDHPDQIHGAPPNTRNRSRTQSRRRQRNQAQSSQAQELVTIEDPSEIKHEHDQQEMVSTGAISKDRQALIEAIDKHLQQKIKDENVRKDDRLRVFITFCLEHKKVINSFIRSNQQILNDSLRNVIIKVPQVLDFDNKRLLFRTQIKKIQKKYRMNYFDIEVKRDQVFADSFEQLEHLGTDKWKGKMNIEFQDEQGIDEGGLTKEWFILLSQGIFNPDLALFLQSNAGSTYYPNPKSTVDPEYQKHFKFIGRIVGKAIYEQQLLDCYFVKAFYKIILGMSLTYHDVEDYDNEFYKNLKWCLENSVEGLGFVFSETVEYFGKTEEIEIVPGGKDIDVTDENKYDYVQKMALHKLYNSVKKQIDNFLQGFYEIVPKQLVQIFDNRELELLISGLPNIDIMDLKENTVYQNYSADTPVVRWLFEALEEFDNSERAEFIQFVTGSSKVPVEGFKGLRGSRGLQKFQIVKFFTNDNNRLPQAHTCFKQLELPEYSSKEQLKERLLTAIKEGKTFGFA